MESRVFEDNLTGDPFKMAYERRQVLNGTKIFNKDHQNYFQNKKSECIVDLLSGDPFNLAFKKKQEQRDKVISKLNYALFAKEESKKEKLQEGNEDLASLLKEDPFKLVFLKKQKRLERSKSQFTLSKSFEFQERELSKAKL